MHAVLFHHPSPFSFCFVDLPVFRDDTFKKTHCSGELPARGLWKTGILRCEVEQLRARFSDRLEAELSMIQTAHSSAFPCSLSETLCPTLDSQPKPHVLYGLCQARLPLRLREISDTQEGGGAACTRPPGPHSHCWAGFAVTQVWPPLHPCVHSSVRLLLPAVRFPGRDATGTVAESSSQSSLVQLKSGTNSF